MKIKTIGTSTKDWIVLADWHGEQRTVKRGSLFECIEFVREVSR